MSRCYKHGQKGGERKAAGGRYTGRSFLIALCVPLVAFWLLAQNAFVTHSTCFRHDGVMRRSNTAVNEANGIRRMLIQSKPLSNQEKLHHE